MIRTRDGIRLDGGKMFCSAAGFATRALVTAVDDAGQSRMLVIALGNGERVRPLEAPLQGMRAAVTGAVDFTGCIADRDACLGEPGDYLREPDFSAGAWRGSAVAAGGLQKPDRHGNRPVADSRAARQSASTATPGQRHDRLGDQPSLGSPGGADRGRSKRRSSASGGLCRARAHRCRGGVPRCDATCAALTGAVGVPSRQPGGAGVPRSRHVSASTRAGRSPDRGGSAFRGTSQCRTAYDHRRRIARALARPADRIAERCDRCRRLPRPRAAPRRRKPRLWRSDRRLLCRGAAASGGDPDRRQSVTPGIQTLSAAKARGIARSRGNGGGSDPRPAGRATDIHA